MASFLCPIDSSNGHSTTVFEGPTKTFQGVILEETISANLDSRKNTLSAKGGSSTGPVSSCYRAEKSNLFGEGVGVNGSSPEDQKIKGEVGGQVRRDNKNTMEQQLDISVNLTDAKLKSANRPEEEGH